MPIDKSTTAHFTTAQITFFNCTFRFYNCTNCDQLHVKICPGYSLHLHSRIYISHHLRRQLFSPDPYIYIYIYIGASSSMGLRVKHDA